MHISEEAVTEDARANGTSSSIASLRSLGQLDNTSDGRECSCTDRCIHQIRLGPAPDQNANMTARLLVSGSSATGFHRGSIPTDAGILSHF